MSFFSTFEFPEQALAGIEGGDAAAIDALAGAIEAADFQEEGDIPKDVADDSLADVLADLRAADAGDKAAPVELDAAMASVRADAEAKGEAKEEMGAKGAAGGAGDALGDASYERRRAEEKRKRLEALEKRKSNSTSTVFLNSTIAVPDVEKILLGVSALLEKMIVSCEDPRNDPFVQCLPPVTRERMYHVGGDTLPTVDGIFKFMKRAFTIAQWSPESNVIAMVLLTRLATSTDVTLNDRNWDKLLLCAFLLAQKLWDDTPLANVDFPLLWQQINNIEADFDLRAVNRMEKLFLTKLHFDIHVDRKTYTQFYFELYSLTGSGSGGGADGGGGALKPISEKAAAALEARSGAAQRQLDSARQSAGWDVDGDGAAQGKGGGGARREAKGSGREAKGSATVAFGGPISSYRSKGGRMVLD